MFYLNIEEYDIMDEINILFTLKNGDMKQLIQLEFNDTIPTKDYDLAQNRGPSSSAYAYYSTSSGIHGTIKYYYDIKKVLNKKYLIIKFFSLGAESITIEISKNLINLIIIIIIFSGVLLVSIIIGLNSLRKYIRSKRIKASLREDEEIEVHLNNAPNNNEQENNSTDTQNDNESHNTPYDESSNNKNTQKDNIYYEPSS